MRYEGLFHISGYPVGHGVFCCAAEKYTKEKYAYTDTLFAAGFIGGIVGKAHFRHRGNRVKYGRNYGKHRKGDNKPHPVMRAEKVKIRRAYKHHQYNAVGVKGVQVAHITLRCIGGQGCDNRA